jgi:hypothetical protein
VFSTQLEVVQKLANLKEHFKGFCGKSITFIGQQPSSPSPLGLNLLKFGWKVSKLGA